MSEPETILRLAAKGDGATAGGTHVPGTAPGDLVKNGALVERGSHHVSPPCRHFERCGGCQLQHVDEETLASFVSDRVANAAKGHGVDYGELLPVHLSPPLSRRRATLHGQRTAKGAVLGYREGGSHRIVDLAECHVISPELYHLIDPLRTFLTLHGPRKGGVDVQLAVSDQGVDVSMSNVALDNLAATEAALDFARDHGLARLSIDQGYGPEPVWEPEPVTILLAGVPVSMPVGAFLQATADAEARMVDDVREWLEGTRVVADLFAGLGTFAFGLRNGRKVLAVEADRAAYMACKSAAHGAIAMVHPMHRDLFRNPLQASEIGRFDAVVLDPPRAGAKAQIGEIAASTVAKVAYVSCNPSSWARDAAVLAEQGFALTKLRPIGQFRWSTHVELVSFFER